MRKDRPCLIPYAGSHQQYDVICESNVMAPMRDGVRLAADIYRPALGGRPADGPFPVILERTPYDKSLPRSVAQAKYYARRGYVCVSQDVRGRFESEGEWYAFAKEAPDGYDTVEWLAAQPWSNGRIGTKGGSYAGSDQSALATLNPTHLETMIVAVGASNYFHSSMRQNGALEQRFHVYIYRMASSSKEAAADPALKAALTKAYEQDLHQIVGQFPMKEGATILSRLPSYERWAIDIMTHGEYGDYWKQRGYAISEYYDEHADVPTLYLGGWYDSYARNTCESYIALSKTKSTRQMLLMGPWTHGQYEVTFAGDSDFGAESVINQNDLQLAWFDRYLKGMDSEAAFWPPVRFFAMGTGDLKIDHDHRLKRGGYWRDEQDWPLPGTRFTPYYLRAGATLSEDKAGDEEQPASQFTFDPRDPVPTMGGGLSAADTVLRAGAFDQRGRPDFIGCKDTMPLNYRGDVLSFQTPPLTGRSRGYRARGDAPVGLVGGAGHRLYGEAGRRLPAGRRLSRRTRDQHHRLDHPRQVPQRLRRARADGAGHAVRVRLPAIPDLHSLPQRAPDQAGREQQQLAAVRREPQHGRPPGTGAELPDGNADHLPQS